MVRQSNNVWLARLPLAWVAAAVLVAAAGAAGVGLWYLKRLHDHAARVMATQAVMEQGEQMSDYLAGISSLCVTNLTPEQWRLFNNLVDGLHAAQHDLQFVSVTRDGVTVVHHQATAFPAEAPATDRLRPAEPQPFRVSVSPQVIELGGTSLPVMVFHRQIELPGNRERVQVDVGFRRSAVDREQKAAAHAIASLFRLSVMTLALAFGACLLLLLWIVRRDRVWSERRRQEEHLAFSGVLANGIVHDFRNPMSSVRLDAQLLERELRRPEGTRPERLGDLAGRIGRTVERMDKVFQEFLYLARPAEEAQEPVDLAACIRECAETLAPRLEQAGVTVLTRWTTPPPPVAASPFALRRALLNVVLNALQFSPARGAIEVDARVAGRWVELDIMDRGPGIPTAERRRVFEMFVTTRPGGTGLGLFLARTAVRKCGGDIAALERPGGGTIVRIRLRTADSSLDGARTRLEGTPPPSNLYPPPSQS